MTMILGAVPCRNCGRCVTVDRVGGYTRVMEGRREHDCAVDPREVAPRVKVPCGAWMPIAGERCARAAGHAGTARYPDHRTRYAMECAARSKRAGWAA